MIPVFPPTQQMLWRSSTYTPPLTHLPPEIAGVPYDQGLWQLNPCQPEFLEPWLLPGLFHLTNTAVELQGLPSQVSRARVVKSSCLQWPEILTWRMGSQDLKPQYAINVVTCVLEL